MKDMHIKSIFEKTGKNRKLVKDNLLQVQHSSGYHTLYEEVQHPEGENRKGERRHVISIFIWNQLVKQKKTAILLVDVMH